MYAATRGPTVKWEAQISNGGPRTTGPPAGDDPVRLPSLYNVCLHFFTQNLLKRRFWEIW